MEMGMRGGVAGPDILETQNRLNTHPSGYGRARIRVGFVVLNPSSCHDSMQFT